VEGTSIGRRVTLEDPKALRCVTKPFGEIIRLKKCTTTQLCGKKKQIQSMTMINSSVQRRQFMQALSRARL